MWLHAAQATEPMLSSRIDSVPAVGTNPGLPKSLTHLGVEVAVVDEAGEPKEVSSQRGFSTVSLGADHAYGIRISNRTEARVWLVLSVDGTNPSTGKRSYIAQPGLVLESGQTVVLKKGRLNKKGDLRPLFESKEEGDFTVGIFQERTDYPLITPGMVAPPYGREAFVVGSDGVRRWVPPKGYPFRKATQMPASVVYLRYMRLDGEG